MVRYRNIFRIAAYVLLKVILVCGSLAQQTIHVPANVSTIQGAIDVANNGDTIQVEPGTYNENIDFKGKSLVVTTGATAFSDTPVASTIINGSTDGPVVKFETHETTSAVLNGFTIQNGHASQASGLNGGGVFISNASPQVTNNVIVNNVGCGVHVVDLASPLIQGNDIKQSSSPKTSVDLLCASDYGGAVSGTGLAIEQAGNVQVIGNTIEDNIINQLNSSSQGCGAGVYIAGGTQLLLRNNIIRNNQSACVPAIYDPAHVSKLLMIQNLIYENTPIDEGIYPFQVEIFGTDAAPYPSLTEINNTIYGEGQELIYTFATSSVSNNIFFNTVPFQASEPAFTAGLSCIGAGTQSSPITFSHNDVFNSGGLQPGGCPLGPGTLTEDPQFLSISTNDYHTQPASPIVAAGDINAPLIPSVDLDGKARTVCETIDMGIYEIRPHPPIVLTSSPNPTPGRSTVTLTAAITGNCNMPTGTITFLDGITILGTASINSGGIATFSTSFLFVGTHVITATYAGDFNFEGSTSNSVTEVITGPPTTTVLTSVSPNPSYPLATITLAAAVNSAYTIPTGEVSFLAGSVVLTTAPVGPNGSASATANTLHAGTHSITARYSGSTQYAASTSNAVTETVLGATTMTSLSASPNPVAPNLLVTFTAKVSTQQSTSAVSGIVTFKDGAVTLGTSAVGASGIATYSTSTLLTGTHSLTAVYGGSQDLNGSTSGIVPLVVTGIPTNIGLNASPNPASIGQSVTMVATAVASLSSAPPTGTVTFSDQSGVLGNAPLVSGVASFSITSLSVGTHQLVATLNPTGPYGGSSSEVVAEVVNNFAFTVGVTPNSVTIPSSDYEIVNVTVTPSGGFNGSVTLSCSQLPAHAQCSFSPNTAALSEGARTVRLTIDTSDVLGYGKQISRREEPLEGSKRNSAPFLAGLLFPLFILFGRRAEVSGSHAACRWLLLVIGMAGICLGMIACSGKVPGATPPGNYVVTITATDTNVSSGLTNSANLNLQVTK